MSCQKIDDVHGAVRDRYSRIARGQAAALDSAQAGCCCGSTCAAPEDLSVAAGYSRDEIDSVPEGANMGLGCGNPSALASLQPGETVLDLGSGGGFDCFLAARQVGESGRVIGVDMTAEMVSRARENARQAEAENVEFRLGEIEHLPVEDGSVDVILSNCVVNLSPQKAMVFREAYRALRPGGRISISDVIARRPLPEDVRSNLDLVSSCVGGAETARTLEALLEEAGFEQIRIRPREESRSLISEWLPESGIENEIVSATIEAVKPAETAHQTGEREASPSGGSPGLPGAPNPKIAKTAQGHFLSGYHCAEVVLKTVAESFGHTPDSGAMRCASGFGGGIAGTTEELCGAFTGGVMAASSLLGRAEPGESMAECGALTKDFKQQFLETFGSMNCRTLLKGFESMENPHLGCVQLTVRAAQILVDLLAKAENDQGIDMGRFSSQPRPKVQLGCCPFNSCA